MTYPYIYLTHITPEEGSGALGVSDPICEWLEDVGQLANVKYAGGDSTNPMTGWKESCMGDLFASCK